jgi:hypothetical protein
VPRFIVGVITMPRPEQTGAGPALYIDGLYEALRLRERQHRQRADAARASWVAQGIVVAPDDWSLLDALEAGEPVVVPASKLGGWMLPRVPLTREQRCWPNQFVVTADDTVRPGHPSDYLVLGADDVLRPDE